MDLLNAIVAGFQKALPAFGNSMQELLPVVLMIVVGAVLLEVLVYLLLDKVFKSKVLDTDDHFSFTFASPGTFTYFCSIHPKMTGKVVVQ